MSAAYFESNKFIRDPFGAPTGISKYDYKPIRHWDDV